MRDVDYKANRKDKNTMYFWSFCVFLIYKA